jgi:hypothetical protein
MIQLETYKGTKTRHTCPACNTRNCFVRYKDENGEYLASDVGRCNRESKCGFHYKPKQFFADNPTMSANGGKGAKNKKRKPLNYATTSRIENDQKSADNSPDYIPFEQFKPTLGNYDQNAFVQFLLNLFSDRAEAIQDVLKMYFVGTYEDYTCFPSIDRFNRICRGKLIRFDLTTGKRLKGQYDTSSLVRKLKLKEDFNYKQIFFGEHLLTKYSNKAVAVVESEKSAIIASLYFPDFIWLGSNSKSWLKAERLERFGNRQIILFPDADGFEKWQQVASEARAFGLSVKVSSLIENHATPEQKASGCDVADFLINERGEEIDEFNLYADDYNAKVDRIISDPDLLAGFEAILEERKSILIADAGLSETEAESWITDHNFVRQIVKSNFAQI